MPFSQTIRALETEKAQFSIFGLSVILLLLLAWLGWFSLARIYQYETSLPGQYSLAEAVVVDFPADSLSRINPGQSAILYLNSDDPDLDLRLSAEVMDVTFTDESKIQVWLQPRLTEAILNNPQEYSVNQVDVEVDYISPLSLLKQSYH